MPKFSVVIPLYNKAQFIVNTINSVLKQSEKDFEIVIINDGSTDNCLEVLSKITDPRIKIFSQKNKGVSAARNLGITKSSSDKIAFLDADDEWLPYFLEEINALINLFPGESIYATAIQLKENNSIHLVKYLLPLKKEKQIINYFTGSKNRSILSGSSVVIRKEVFNSIGNFDEKLISGEDTDFWIRSGLKYNVAFSTKVAVSYNQLSNSLSKTSYNAYIQNNLLKFKEEENLNPDLKKIIDLNRFSFAILSKRIGNKQRFLFYKKHISKSNLNWKQKLLLSLPKSILNILFYLKKTLNKNGILLRVLD